ncbi:phycobiliprotein lyase [Tumidithrix elongata RA019]|uniref:Chromophore lyase CpcS/CpeS n=1 Tax=Tumidithrix elongata BACA0141 TaxID=2716417 RepID=A0AAW9PY77_9CYAN|nr:phycobiliprotein lyase [Tumidithrix elongata RA019]
MNIKEFFQHRAGAWSSQRTSHNPFIQKSESSNSVIQIALAEATDPQITALCQQYNFIAEQVFCAAKINWDRPIDRTKGSSILVAIADRDDVQQGKLLSQHSGEKSPVLGRYTMEKDDVLRLVNEHDGLFAEEKLWFPRPNICMRTSVTIGTSKVSSFCTEIRKAEPAKSP